MHIFNKIISLTMLLSFSFSHGISDSDKSEMVHGSLTDFILLGAKHMITGYDHILFLIGVIFFLTKFTDIVKFVTAFTLGHSITLIFATLFQITANYYLIDAIIALSVIYKGFENLGGFKKLFSIEPPNLVLMVFIFGLIHGFGLSTRLQQIALDEHNILYSILSFNVGVELGQIGALAIVFPIIFMTRGKFINVISKIANWGLIVAGSYLVVFQLSQYFAEEHSHHHGKPVIEEVIIEEEIHHKHENDSIHSHDEDHHHKENHSHDHNEHENDEEDSHHH
jgi:hypothetical protein